MSLLVRIDRCLRCTRMRPTTFGRRAINDPRLVGDLRLGRQPRARTVARIEALLTALDSGGSAGEPGA